MPPIPALPFLAALALGAGGVPAAEPALPGEAGAITADGSAADGTLFATEPDWSPLPEGTSEGPVATGALIFDLPDPDLLSERDPLDPFGLEIPDRSGPDPEDPLVRMALKVAPAVVTLRAWDEFGTELSNGVGFFANDQGLIVTDASVLHPDFSARIDYLTAADGFGEPLGITGVRVRDLRSGVALLQSDATGTPTLPLDPAGASAAGGADDREVPVRIVAVKDGRGLVLADGELRTDDTVSGAGWLEIRGENSPGAVGSPILDLEGRVVGLVSMRLPLERWLNYGVPIEAVEEVLRGPEAPLRRAAELPDGRETSPVRDREFIRAFRDLYGGRAESAARHLLRLTKVYPRSAECWALLGLAAARLGSRGDALGCLARAASLDPEVGAYWNQLAIALLSESAGRPGNPDDGSGVMAMEALEQAVEYRPGDALAWLLYGEACLGRRAYDRADSALRQVVKLESRWSHPHFLLGYVRVRLGDLDGAAEALQRSVSLDRTNDSAWFCLGLLHSRNGEHRRAVEAFEAAVRANRNHPNAWQNLAYAYRRVGRETEAGEAFRRHLQVDARRVAAQRAVQP